MKTPKKAIKCQQIIDDMVKMLGYYMGHCPEFKKLVREDVQYLETYLNEISEEHKTYNIRFASKLKSLWKHEMKEKDAVIKELEHKIKEIE